MFCCSLVSFLAIACFALPPDEKTLVRQREEQLADAINSHNRAHLSALTTKNFHLSWNAGSSIRNFSTEMNQEEWLNQVTRLRLKSYEIEISQVSWAGPKSAPPSSEGSAVYVTLQEFWTLFSPRGHAIEQRVKTVDLWMKEQGTWKLATRFCHSDLP